MQMVPVRTRALLPPKDDLLEILGGLQLQEGDIVCISSKVLAIHQGRCVPVAEADKNALISSEAELVFAHSRYPSLPLTIKAHTLIPAAGIDESNGNGHYVLWPENVGALLKEFTQHLKGKHKLSKLALIATDSALIPLRAGVVGISIGHYGLEPVRDYRGKRDIFGRSLEHTQVNIVDALAAAAVLQMGEGDERTPIVVVRGADDIVFTDSAEQKLYIAPEHDLYRSFLE